MGDVGGGTASGCSKASGVGDNKLEAKEAEKGKAGKGPFSICTLKTCNWSSAGARRSQGSEAQRQRTSGSLRSHKEERQRWPRSYLLSMVLLET